MSRTRRATRERDAALCSGETIAAGAAMHVAYTGRGAAFSRSMLNRLLTLRSFTRPISLR